MTKEDLKLINDLAEGIEKKKQTIADIRQMQNNMTLAFHKLEINSRIENSSKLPVHLDYLMIEPEFSQALQKAKERLLSEVNDLEKQFAEL